ncbi:MAG: glycoside hydrolase family 47 protein [Microbacterium hominis]|nr:glycoside hydrolase family 47 protein [Microbacterium hominis]
MSWFETTIRYLGGLLSAYELSGDPLMLERATELGDWLLPAFATEYGLPVNRYIIGSNPNGGHNGRQSLAEVGSMTLEMTRLSQLTGNEVYFRAAQRALDTLDQHFLPAQEPKDPTLANGPTYRGRLGTLLPAFIDPSFPYNLQGDYTLGGLADSYYEYLIKQAHLTSMSHDQYSRMYREAMDGVLKYLVRPLEVIPGRHDLALLGTMNWGGWQAELQHLACFAGGM